MTRRRVIVFRIAAVCLGMSVFLIAELLCLAFDWGHPNDHDDPFVGFESVVPLFVPDDAGENMVIPRARRKFFAAESFPVEKKPGTMRIFCLGGSTVQGRPFSIETSFSTWLEFNLKTADPDRHWEVINCGGISYASYRLVPILQECMVYAPDLFIICTGHNEFLEDRTYAQMKNPSVLGDALRQSRIFTLMHSAAHADEPAPDKPMLATDVRARLDFRGGLEQYERDEDWQNGVVRHFETNLRRMIRLCAQRDVPLILMRPPSNLADCPPFKSQPGNDDVTAEVARLIREARSSYAVDLSQSIRLLEQAARLDPHRASSLYELGKACESANRYAAARTWFVRARDEDVCPLRMISRLESVLDEVGREEDVEVLNLHALLEDTVSSGILGDGPLVDHIHPSLRGHQRVAKRLVEHMAERDLISPASDWEEAARRKHAEHLASLDDLYFLRGRRTLEALRNWAAGRAEEFPQGAEP